ncbi:M23 family metallopeptidase [Lysinibacillus piscis]|uniref:Metalloendopeptidase n=1 Tax=Lysinibacillus piscis TaxID=2518931 RepID=A0ABQ5NPP1_9BACI|nr:M23 family metallopeptidase [Lysinibacillus sp. KH24]GLC90081.1 metalloendopeptidase [Lysinibacillus sp. KH24]
MNSFGYKKEEGKQQLSMFSSIKKISIVAVIATSLTINAGFAKENPKEHVNKIYHVYVGDKYIGAVSNEQVVQDLVAAKEKEAQQKYSSVTIDIDSTIKIIPEQVFTNETKDDETIELLKQTLVAQSPAFTLFVNNQPVISLKDAQAYDETIRLLKLQYVSQQELDSLPAVPQAATLQSGESRLLNITFKQEVSGVTQTVSPEVIVTPQEAVQYLMTGALVQEKYEIQSGDVLGSVAKKHGLTTAELVALNPDITVDTVLQIGQPLNVTVAKPFVTLEVKQEKKVMDTVPFKKITEEDPTMYKNEKVVKQQGVDGKKETTYLLTSENGTRTSKVALNEEILQQPVDQIEVIGTKVISSRGTGEFVWPTVGGYISSTMGYRWGTQHRGIDIARPSNYNILAADNGVVVAAGFSGSYGNRIVINHNNGYTTLYGHLSSIKVEVGQVVEKGSLIGIMGSTGNSTGTHLHFEVEKGGSLVNPLAYVGR